MGKKRQGKIQRRPEENGGYQSVRPEESDGHQSKIDAKPPSTGELKSVGYKSPGLSAVEREPSRKGKEPAAAVEIYDGGLGKIAEEPPPATGVHNADTGKGEMIHGHTSLSSGHEPEQIGSDPEQYIPPPTVGPKSEISRHGAESSSATFVSQPQQDAIVSSGGQEPPNPDDDLEAKAGDLYRQSGWTYIFYLILYILLGSTYYYVSQVVSKGTQFSGGSRSFIDGLYLSTQTVTTVGYGDVLPATTLSKTFIVCYVSAGLFLIAIVYEIASEALGRFESWIIPRFRTKNSSTDSTILKEKQLVIRILISLAGLLLSIAGCAVALHHWENLKPLKAAYVSVVSVTTLGFGDLSFQSSSGRVFFSFWILVSYLLVFRIVAMVTELIQSRRRKPAFWINPLKRFVVRMVEGLTVRRR